MSCEIEPITGRARVFADSNINTDLIMPSEAFRLPLGDQVKLLFAPYRPGWVATVRPGDILVAGRNFGTGSSRPAAQLLKAAGIVALVAESINDLFYRNCVNYALPAMECSTALALADEGDILTVDICEGSVLNARTNSVALGPQMPLMLREILAAGGLMNQLRRADLLE